MVLRRFEQRQRVSRKSLEVVDRTLATAQAELRGDRVPGRPARLVAQRIGARRRCLGDLKRPRPVGPEGRVRQLDLGMEVERMRPQEREATPEQPGRRAVIAAPERPPPGGGEPLAGRECQRSILPPDSRGSGSPVQGGSRQSPRVRRAPGRARRASARSDGGGRPGPTWGVRRRRHRESGGDGTGNRRLLRAGRDPGGRAGGEPVRRVAS